MNTDKPSLIVAVSAVRKLGIFVEKTAKNTGLNSNYADYGDVWLALKPELERNGIAVGFLPSVVKNDQAWIQDLIMEISVGSEVERVTFQVLFPEGNRGVNLTQRQGMAHTYGKRYALIDYFHMITGDDDDAMRLGQQRVDESAPKAQPDQHWEELCHCPLFATGHEESQGSWAMLADPSGDGSQTLGDLADGAKAKLWTRYPDHPGINAWRAELIQKRAEAKGIADWEACRAAHKSMNMPQYFRECSGEQLNNLSLALR